MIDLSFSSVSKRYRIKSEHEAPAKNFLSGIFRPRTQTRDFWALRNVNFEVKRGEALGIIGHNGAGKSTILKLLSNVTTPTQGEIAINGKLSAMLEVGSGFHPELTGRENIFLSGAILGMRRNEIKRKLDNIIDFAEMRALIDNPAKKYSSGMFVRLGFSIAAHLDPDILLLDEVLAVGDFTFQERCKRRIFEMHESGTTLVFISHDLTAVRELCQRVILLQRGEVIAEGSPDAVIRRYTDTAAFQQRPQVDGSRDAEVTDVGFYDACGERTAGFRTGDPVTVRVEYLIHRDIPQGDIALLFFGTDGSLAAQWTTSLTGSSPFKMQEGSGCVEFSCRELGLQPGIYRIDVQLEDSKTKEPIDRHEGCANIHVVSSRELKGSFYMPHTWQVVPPRSGNNGSRPSNP